MLNKIDIKGASVKYLAKLQDTLNAMNFEAIDKGIEIIAQAWLSEKQIITMGNGGSAITALHCITDWNKMIPAATGISFKGRTLIDNMGLITAFSNDLSYSQVFVEQLKNILQPGDLVIAISGSGNSENIVKAIDYANEHQAVTLGLCGYDGGQLKKSAQYVIHVDRHDMQLSEDVHAIFCHIVMQTLTGYLAKSAPAHERNSLEEVLTI